MLKGVLFSVSASFLFGCIYYLSVVLQPIEGEQLFGWRIIFTTPFLLILLLLLKQQKAFKGFLCQLKAQPYLWLVLMFTSANTAVQMWLFLWAPVNGKAIEVSIGYLLMPLVMVLIGRMFYKERISKIKAFAILFAIIGVSSNIIVSGVFSWESALVCVGYPVYFAVRKYFKILHLSSFTLEMMLMLPISIYFASQSDMQMAQVVNPNIYYGLALLGIISGIALSLYILSSQILPINLLGLLGYLEPFFMLFVSFLIGEVLQPSAYVLMFSLMIAVGLLIMDGVVNLKLKQKSA